MKESWNFGNSQCYSFFCGSYNDTYSTSLDQSICSTWITYFKAYCFPWMLLGGSFPQPDSSTSPQLLRLMLLSKAALVFCICTSFHHPLLPRGWLSHFAREILSASLFLCHVCSGDSTQYSYHMLLLQSHPMSFDLFPKLLKICHTALVLSLSPAIVLKNGVMVVAIPHGLHKAQFCAHIKLKCFGSTFQSAGKNF